MELENLRTAATFFAYDTGRGEITTWSGAKVGTVVSNTDSPRNHRHYVTVRDIYGAHWHGSGPRETGTYVRLHRKGNAS
jgi:hypothetical protein